MSNRNRTSYLDSTVSKNDDLSNKTKQEEESRWYHPLSQKIEHLYMRFLLETTLYVMEPWERTLVMSIFFLLISLVSYSAFVFIPFHIHKIIQSSTSA